MACQDSGRVTPGTQWRTWQLASNVGDRFHSLASHAVLGEHYIPATRHPPTTGSGCRLGGVGLWTFVGCWRRVKTACRCWSVRRVDCRMLAHVGSIK